METPGMATGVPRGGRHFIFIIRSRANTSPTTTRGMRLPDVPPGSTSPGVVPLSDSMIVGHHESTCPVLLKIQRVESPGLPGRFTFRSRGFGLDAPSLLPPGVPLSSTTRVQTEVQHASADSILLTNRFKIGIRPHDFPGSLIGNQEVASQAIGLIFHVRVFRRICG